MNKQEEISVERKKFEDVIQYRQFLELNKDGSYKLEWVEGRWQGWLLKYNFDMGTNSD